jgi:hypothetical protein
VVFPEEGLKSLVAIGGRPPRDGEATQPLSIELATRSA